MNNLRIIDVKLKSVKEVTEEAERILELAKSGEITDISWSASCVDGSLKTSFTSTTDAPRRLCGVYRLAHRLQLKMDESDI